MGVDVFEKYSNELRSRISNTYKAFALTGKHGSIAGTLSPENSITHSQKRNKKKKKLREEKEND